MHPSTFTPTRTGRSRTLFISLFLPAFLFTVHLPPPELRADTATGAGRALENWLPADVVGFVKLSDPGEALRGFLASDFRRQVEGLWLYQYARTTGRLQKVENQLARVEEAAGRDLVDVVNDLLGEEAVVALRFGFPPSVLVATRSRSAGALEAGLESLRSVVRSVVGEIPPSQKSTRHGVVIENIANKIFHATVGDTFLASSGAKAVEDMIDLGKGKAENSAARSDAFASVFDQRGKSSGTLVTAALRPGYIPDLRVPEKADNPLASLLGSGWLEAFRTSDLLTARLRNHGGRLSLTVDMRSGSAGLETGVASIFFPGEGGRGDREDLARLRETGVLGLIHLRRDIASWWERREDFLVSRAAGQLLNANSFLSIFFGGISFQDEVLPRLESGITLVSRRLDYRGLDPKPQPQIPGLAAIFRLRDADKMNRRIVSAFQSIMTVINMERAKNKMGGVFLLDLEKVGDQTIYVGNLDLPGEKKGETPGIEHNFAPSVAIVGPRVILGSNKELTRDLVELLGSKKPRKAPAEAAAREVDLFTVRAAELGKLLLGNQEFLVNRMILDEGVGRQEAEGRIRAGSEILGLFRGASIRTHRKGDTSTVEFSLELEKGSGGAQRAASARGKF